MLEGIDDIPWASLQHAYGPADDVPVILKALAAHEITEEDAVSRFWGNIWHQGTVYEATSYAVPFLIELLFDPDLEDRWWLLLLLNSIATGSSYRDIHGNDLYPEPADVFEQGKSEELGWVERARGAVRAGVTRYLNLLQAEEKEIRTAAALLLSGFLESRAEILPELRLRLVQEQQHEVQASLMLCLGVLEDADPATHSLLGAALRKKPSDPRPLAAALSIIRIDKEKAAPQAVSIVLNALTNPEDFPESYAFEIWELDSDPGLEILETLLFLGPARAVSAMTSLLETLEEPLDALVDLVTETAFPLDSRARTEPRVMTWEQRRVLTALLHADNAWDTQGRWNLGTGVPDHLAGLPQTRDALQAYLSESEAQ